MWRGGFFTTRWKTSSGKDAEYSHNEQTNSLSSASASRLAFKTAMIIFGPPFLVFFTGQNAFQSVAFPVFGRHTLLSTSARFDADGFSAFLALF